MRAGIAIAWSLVAACGFSPRATETPPARDGDLVPVDVDVDGSPPPPDASPAPFALTGLWWTVPCTGPHSLPHSCTCANPAPMPMTVQLAGSAGDHWLVTAHLRGVVEALAYAHGSAGSGEWYVGGDTGGDNGDNIYDLAVSSPKVIYYLNHGTPGGTAAIDYTVSFPVDGDALLTFTATGQDGAEWQDFDAATGSSFVVPGLPTPPDLGSGQYAELTVVSATRL